MQKKGGWVRFMKVLRRRMSRYPALGVYPNIRLRHKTTEKLDARAKKPISPQT